MQICEAKGRHVATIMDLQGPEIRTSYLIDRETKKRIDKVEVKPGDVMSLYGTNDLSEVRVLHSYIQATVVRSTKLAWVLAQRGW